MGSEVGHVDSPRDRPIDLCGELAVHLVGVGVFPQVVDVAWEAALAREERRRMRDRSPPIRGMLGVERQVHTDVVARPYIRAACWAQGAGTMIDAQVADPSRSAS